MRLEELRNRVVKAALLAQEEGLLVMTSGNFSERDPETGLIGVTPTTFPYKEMRAEHIVLVDVDGNVIEAREGFKPSSDYLIHCAFYRALPDAVGVVHAHPIYTNAWGLVGKEVPALLPTIHYMVRGTVPISEVTNANTDELRAQLIRDMGDRRAVVAANHGIYAYGRSVGAAVTTAVYAEERAKVAFLARQLGEPRPLQLRRSS